MRHLIIALFTFVSFTLFSQTIPEPPSPPRLVNDLVGILNPSNSANLEQRLVEFNDATSTQIVVVVVPSFDGTEASDFAFKLGEKWGIGQKGKNNGILILVKPKTQGERGGAFIAVGYGLEGIVPDAIARRIVDNEMIPHFKKGDYDSGIAQAVSTLMGLTKGEFTADQYTKKAKKKGSSNLFVIIIVIVVVIIAIAGGNNNNNKTLGGSNLPFWMLLGALGSSRGSGGGGFGGFSSGSGSFGGFGGGSFGGGGAGGSW